MFIPGGPPNMARDLEIAKLACPPGPFADTVQAGVRPARRGNYESRGHLSVHHLRSRRWALIAIAVLVLAAYAAAAPRTDAASHRARESPGPWCGGALWRQMAFSDPDRGKVDVAPEPTTIAKIAQLATPQRITTSRTTSFQRTVWSLHAVVDRYRIASNGEIVLILFSIDSGRYMNAYLPNPHCLSDRTRQRSAIVAARQAFTSRCPGVVAAWQLLGATVDVSGVGFWNPARTTRGALQNGAELRPVTNLAIDFGCGVD
jgi:hypothetical protein